MRANSGGKGSKSITVFDVARVAGVSKSTVSLVLTGSDKVSDKAKLKVEQAIEATGYVYNREAASLRSRRSNLVALVINDLTNPYSAQLAVGLERHISQMGMFSMIVNSGENVDTQAQLVKNLKEYNVAAFIMCPAPGTTAKWTNDLVEQGFPVIHIMREIDGANVPSVLPDNISGTRQATEHLLQSGYRRIAFLGGNESISDYHQRLCGFVEAMKQADVDCPQHLHIQSDTNRHGGRQAMLKALETEPGLDAVICFSDVIAYGAIEQMRASGKEPGKDIAIVGFDDLEDSRLMSPALSTVHIDADKIGASVCKILANIKENGQQTMLVDVELIARESS
ncbi:MAG: LacI family transcriptional regulator [Phenylobacterium sp.]|jgi:LacI family transcriptional regulator